MLEEFVHRHDVDIALLQDVTDGDKLVCKGYHSTINIGTTGRGTAILHKLNIQLHRIERIPSGRGTAVYFDDTCIVNIYAPSGTVKRAEREDFFNSGLLRLLPLKLTKLNLAGDFNCVINNNDCTGQRTCSRALERLINGLRLKDDWDTETNPHVYIQYTPAGAARIDRIYLSEDLLCNKQGGETIAAAFTDHLAVLIRIKLATPIILRGRCRRCMNTSLLKDAPSRRKLRAAWNEWTKHIKRYPDIMHWWVHYVKQKIKLLFT